MPAVAPKILLAPLRESPQSGFARYYIPAIPDIERDDRTLHRYASVLPLQPANALVSGVEPLDGWANLYSSKFRQFWLAILGPLFRGAPEERRMLARMTARPRIITFSLARARSCRPIRKAAWTSIADLI